jgi:hypothetical protein
MNNRETDNYVGNFNLFSTMNDSLLTEVLCENNFSCSDVGFTLSHSSIKQTTSRGYCCSVSSTCIVLCPFTTSYSFHCPLVEVKTSAIKLGKIVCKTLELIQVFILLTQKSILLPYQITDQLDCQSCAGKYPIAF